MKKFLVAFLTIIMVVSTALLVACGQTPKVEIKFDGNGGVTSDGRTTVTIEVAIRNGELDEFMAPVFTRDGYTFAGWSVDLSTIKQDTIVAAQWATAGKIVYDGNGGETADDKQTVTVDFTGVENVPNNEPTFTRDGFKFLGWDKTATQIEKELSTNPTTTVSAKWGKRITVTYDGNGGTTGDNQTTVTQEFVVGDTENPAYPVFTRDTYEFTTWVPHPQDFTNDTDATQTVCAQWEPEAVYIVYDGNGGMTSTEQTSVEKLYEGVASLDDKPVFTRDGFKFLGWDKNDVQIGQELNTNRACTVSAKWGKIINVTFNGDGGVTTDSQTTVTQVYVVGDPDNLALPVFTKESYSFAGWDVDPSTFTNDTDATQTVTAQWTQLKSVVINYDTKGGSACASYTLYEGNYAYNLPKPTKGTPQAGNDYSFTGWWYKASASATAVQITSIAQIWALNEAEITLYATWESNWIGPY